MRKGDFTHVESTLYLPSLFLLTVKKNLIPGMRVVGRLFKKKRRAKNKVIMFRKFGGSILTTNSFLRAYKIFRTINIRVCSTKADYNQDL